jgi:hemolysin III
MNGCTHGLGIILAIVGAVLLSRRARDMSLRHVISCAVYSLSLLMLYTSSTLYHSFFALQNTRYIFEVLDKCAIYILIAGSYTPFITIIMNSHFHLQVAMLLFIWLGTFAGIYVEFYHPTWKHKTVFSLSMYLGMGWVAAFAPKDVVAIVPPAAKNLIILGGVGYTSGVPFFLRNNFLDHSIWHLFVLTASIFHWAAVYFYIIYME